MKKKFQTASVLLFILTALVFAGCSSTAGGGGGDGQDGNTFTNGGRTLQANTSTSSDGNSKTTTVTENGTTLLTLTVTLASATLSFPGQGDNIIPFRQPLSSLPTDAEMDRMAVWAAGQMVIEGALPDNPGCDWFPDTQCTLGCCADHDQCYNANSCGASSWLPLVGSAECDNCNSVAYDCITTACAGLNDSATSDRCYDHRCNQFYDCPDGGCDCASPCLGISPPTCGDGVCGTDETIENCFADCGAGSSPSQCCVDTNNCPGETGHSCGVGCCCCGSGFACGSDGVVEQGCVPTP